MVDQDKDQKTEEATPRRRHETREMGQVAFSSDLTSAVVLVSGAIAIGMSARSFFATSGHLVNDVITAASVLGRDELATRDVLRLMRTLASTALPLMLGILLPMLVCGSIVAFMQVGFQITPKVIALDPAKINPLKGISRMFSPRSLVRLSTSAAKLFLIGTAMAVVAMRDIPRYSALGGAELRPTLRALTGTIVKCAAVAALAILLLAIVDFYYQRYQHDKELRMSKEEVKREHRDAEGDPHVKSRIRRIQRDMALRRMMADVPKATVVITNPTHYAVALSYDREESTRSGRAPRVVAKGVDRVAERIKEIARGAGVPCYENVGLARMLHAQTEVGEEIPEELFQAVAQVLAYVYRLQGQRVSV